MSEMRGKFVVQLKIGLVIDYLARATRSGHYCKHRIRRKQWTFAPISSGAATFDLLKTAIRASRSMIVRVLRMKHPELLVSVHLAEFKRPHFSLAPRLIVGPEVWPNPTDPVAIIGMIEANQ